MALPESDLQFTVSVKKDKSIDPDEWVRLVKDSLTSADDLLSKSGKGTNAKFKYTKKSANASLKPIEKKMRAILKKMDGATETALRDVLEQIKSEAVQLTPEDTGKLRASAFVATDILKTVVQGRVGYNIIDGLVPSGVQTGVNYAVFIHENRMANFRVGQAGFLLEAMNRHAGDVGTALSIKLGVERHGL